VRPALPLIACLVAILTAVDPAGAAAPGRAADDLAPAAAGSKPKNRAPAPAPPPTDPAVMQPAGEDSTADAAYGDPSRALGATSPSCAYALDAESRRACRASGSPGQPHPLSAYGIDVRVGFSLTDPGKTFMSALQSLGAGLWIGLLYLIKAVLLLLEWAFSLDLTSQAMPSIRRTLARLHGQVFGEPWLLLAITLTGLWGMWTGLIRGRTVETFGGLAATVALLICGLVVISRPAETVGRAAKLTNDAGLSVLAAGTSGDARQPRQALARAIRGIFHDTVRNPWCALEFGSVAYCDGRTGDRTHPTTAELWLQYPAQSWQRDRLHAAMKPDKKDGGLQPIGIAKGLLGLDDDRKLPDDITRLVDKDRERARLQEAGGTFPRLALLGTVAFGVLGAVALFAYLGLRLLLAAAMTLLLLLIAPAMLIAPALGQRGRATFVAWGQRLIGAILAKLVFAVFLTIVLAASQVFTSLDIGWFGTWLLLGAFWWGVFLKRDELIGYVSAGVPEQRGDGSTGQALSQAYYGWMLSRGLGRVAGAAANPVRRGAGAMRDTWREDRAATHAARQEVAQEHLAATGQRALAEEHASAQDIVGHSAKARRELGAIDRRLRGYDEVGAAALATNGNPPIPSREQRALIKRRAELHKLLVDPAVAHAAELSRHGRRNEALTGAPISQRDVEVYQARRDRELAATDDPADPRHLVAAGVDPAEFRQAPQERQIELREQVTAHLRRERRHREVAAGASTARHDIDDFADPEALRRRKEEHRARLRDERRRARAEQGVFRHR
jgi:hypothetical protein